MQSITVKLVCTKCPDRPVAGWEHVHEAIPLPRQKHGDGHQIAHGYVTELIGFPWPRLLTFFAHLEPAVVFGRAGRQSGCYSMWGVHPAAVETRWDQARRDDVQTLHVDVSTNLRSHDGEAQTFERWVAGTTPASSSYVPGARRRGAPAH